jgi:hypothetical protein
MVGSLETSKGAEEAAEEAAEDETAA